MKHNTFVTHEYIFTKEDLAHLMVKHLREMHGENISFFNDITFDACNQKIIGRVKHVR